MRSAIALLVLVSVPAAANGQICQGNTPHVSGAIKASAGLEVGGNESSHIWGGASIGRPQSWFGGATIGILSGGGESSLGLGVHGGLELKKPIADRLDLCPMAGIRRQFGDFGFTDFIAAVSAAYQLGSASAKTRLMLVGGYQGIYERYSAAGFTAEEWYGNLDLGLGMIFNQRFSFVPQLRIPIRYGGGRDLSFLLRGSVNLGK
jgi:hypothetical protein